MKGTMLLALRNVLRQRRRSALTLVAIALGACALVLAAGFVADIYIQLAETLIHSQSGHLQIARRGYFAGGSRKPEQFVIEDVEGIRKAAASLPGVVDAMARVAF